MELPINYAAIAVAAVVNFFIGFVWYTPLFGKAWQKELKMDIPEGAKPPAGLLIRGLIMGIIGQFLMVYVFAHNNAAWSFVPGMDQMGAGGIVMSAAVFTWLGFFVPVDLNRVAWEGASWKLFFINAGYHFVIVTVAAAITIMWK